MKIKVPAFETKSLVKLEIPGVFYQRIQSLMFYFISLHSKEEFEVSFNKLTAGNKPENALDLHLQTLLTLISETEQAMQKQNLTTIEVVDIDESSLSEQSLADIKSKFEIVDGN